MKKPELLLPAGSLETLYTAVHYGADAVYIGGEAFSLRAAAKNFSPSEMQEGICHAHANGCKVYVTANILAHNADLADAADYFSFLGGIGPDAILISDPGLFRIARRICPQINLHISTQANNTNAETFLFWHALGAKRVVCGRELSLSEIAQIRAEIPDELEIEAFVHGAMCISYSGRCLMSSYFTGRDANRGACTHPCRWQYSVVEESRPGEVMPVYENGRGTYIFSSKDLCMIDHIPDLVYAGIDSLKVEGRMKSALYMAVIARAYRRAIDEWFDDPAAYEAHLAAYRREVKQCVHRDYCTGFFYGKPDEASQLYDRKAYADEYTYLGSVEEILPDGRIRLTQKNKFSVGEQIEILRPDGGNIAAAVTGITDADHHAQESAPHACQVIYAALRTVPESAFGAVQVRDVLRRKN